jgi:thymidylate kinase
MSSLSEPPLSAIVDLFKCLNAEGIRYCHWKSNCNLDRSIRGLTDLDLLIDPRHGERFRLILHQYDIKPVVSPPDKRYPAIEDYLGFDPCTGDLFHLHVHYQLILGEPFVKNYRLPLEEAFLNNPCMYQGLVKIPAPELELALLAIRALLKYRDRDVVKDILSIRSPGLTPAILREFDYLLKQTDVEKIVDTLQSQVDFIAPQIILELLTTVVESPRSGQVLCRLRSRLRSELSPYQRYSRWFAIVKYWRMALRQHLPLGHTDFPKKIPATGGRLVAVIGADGAGKSLLVGELHAWLSWKIQTCQYYMGSQRPSRTSRSLHLAARMAGKAQRVWSRLVGENRRSSQLLFQLQRALRNLYHVAVGRDRYRRYRSAKQQATRGAIALCDRYPLAAIWQVMKTRPMDGPQIAVEAGREADQVTRTLARMEQDVYRKICPPDHLFVMHVSPEVSQQRKPDHDRGMIEAKASALQQMERQGLHVIEVDADQPLEQVLLQAKAALWQLL